MDIWVDADLADEEIDRWEPVYDMVYMAAPDPVDADDRHVGIVGEAELESRLLPRRPSPASAYLRRPIPAASP
jgi:hypothetical protein